jgi:hypothetical protein
VHSGKLETFKASLPAFVDKTAAEKKNLFYGFTINGDEVFCREGYTDAEGVLAHLDNVGALLAESVTKPSSSSNDATGCPVMGQTRNQTALRQ